MSWLSKTIRRNTNTIKKIAAVAAPVAVVSTGGLAAPALASGGGSFLSSITKGVSGLTSFLGKSGNKATAPAPVESGVVTTPATTSSFLGVSKPSTPTLLIIGGAVLLLFFGWRFIARLIK